MNTEQTRTRAQTHITTERQIICDGCLYCQDHCECGPRGTPAPCDLKFSPPLNPCAKCQSNGTLEQLAHVRKIVDLYFSPWGAAKAAMWEELVGDGPFSPEIALRLIRDIISTMRPAS